MIGQADFDAQLDAWQGRQAEEADDAAERSWTVAARPAALKAELPFSELRVGDFITADGVRWAEVIDLRGPLCYVKSRQESAAEGVSVLFEIPEPVTVSGETRYWIDRPLNAPVTVDMRARGASDGN